MDKRFQVFISSTYTDLQEERQAVIKTVMTANCIPAGMELFPTADEEQLAFIKRVIDDCDYYILIIGARYGSVAENGLSYTEQEYDYAVGKNIPVIALIHESPDDIMVRKADTEPALKEKLERFRKKVRSNRLVKPWKNIHDLPGLVLASLQSEIHRAPGVGWVRADKVANEQVLFQMTQLQAQNKFYLEQVTALLDQNKELGDVIAKLESAPTFTDLAGLDEEIVIPVIYWRQPIAEKALWTVTLKWRDIFGIISPHLIGHPPEDSVASFLVQELMILKQYTPADLTISGEKINDYTFKTIGIQLKALGLVNIEYTETTNGGMAVFWSLTPAGDRLMMEVRTVRAAAEKTSTSVQKKDRLAGSASGE